MNMHIFNLINTALLVLLIVAGFIFGQRFLDSSYRFRTTVVIIVILWATAWAVVEHV